MNDNFYVIGLSFTSADGIGTMAISTYSYIKYAIENNMIPIVDFMHYENFCFKDGKRFHENAWEYFFEQPLKYGLNDIKPDANVSISPPKSVGLDYLTGAIDIPTSHKDILNKAQTLAKTNFKKWIRPNIDVIKKSDEILKKILPNGVKMNQILGVLCRGSDLVQNHPKGKWIQAPLPSIIQEIKENLRKHSHLKYVYCATEDQLIFDVLKKEFGDTLLDNPQYKYKMLKHTYILDETAPRTNHAYQLGIEYLASLWILSQCEYFIGGRCHGSLLVWLWNDKLKEFYVPKIGKY